MPENHDDKYIVFKRVDFTKWLWLLSSQNLLEKQVPALFQQAEAKSLSDAVVIRRQDFFAAPALAGYAASIALAVRLTDDDEQRKALLGIADYFERQAQMAADEGFKFPDV